jgi:type II secretory pathway component PulC
MSRARYLLRNINLINIMLTGVLIFFVNYMLLPFLNKSMQYSLPVIKKHEEIDSGGDKKADQTKTPSPLDYAVIVEQNLFHPERKIPVEKKEAKPLAKPDFVLYGTLITEDLTIAYMEDKKSRASSSGREKWQTPLKLGESMSGFVLKEVEKDQVVMQRGEEKIVVSLNDAKARESAAPAGTGTAAATQTPGQPAQTVQQKPPSPEPGQQIRQEIRPSAATASKKAGSRSPSSGPIRITPSSRKPRTSGGGWFGNSLSE